MFMQWSYTAYVNEFLFVSKITFQGFPGSNSGTKSVNAVAGDG